MENLTAYSIVPLNQYLQTIPDRKTVEFEHLSNTYRFQYEYENINGHYVFYILNYEKYLFPLLPLSFFMMRSAQMGAYLMIYKSEGNNYAYTLLEVLGQEILKDSGLNKSSANVSYYE